MKPQEEEIHFLVDEITEHVNKEIGSILQQLKDPQAKKRVAFIQKFTQQLINASCTKSQKPALTAKQQAIQDQQLQQYVEDVAQYSRPPIRKIVQPPYIPQQYPRTPYYTSIVQPQQVQSKELKENSFPQKQEVERGKERRPEEAIPEKKGESELETITKETVQLDFKKEKDEQPKANVSQVINIQQQKTREEQTNNLQERQRISLIKESETKQTVVFAELTKDFYQLAEPPLTEEEHALLLRLEKDLAENKEVAKDKTELYAHIQKTAGQMKIRIRENEEETKLKLRYYLIRDLFNLQQIEPLLHDEQIEKIICEGVEKPVVIIRNGKQWKTNIVFSHQEAINAVLEQVAKKTYQQLSLDEPILDATYKEFRVQGNIGTEMVPAKFIIVRE